MIYHRLFKDLPRAEEFKERCNGDLFCGLSDSPTKQDYDEMIEAAEGFKDENIAKVMPYMVRWLE